MEVHEHFGFINGIYDYEWLGFMFDGCLMLDESPSFPSNTNDISLMDTWSTTIDQPWQFFKAFFLKLFLSMRKADDFGSLAAPLLASHGIFRPLPGHYMRSKTATNGEDFQSYVDRGSCLRVSDFDQKVTLRPQEWSTEFDQIC